MSQVYSIWGHGKFGISGYTGALLIFDISKSVLSFEKAAKEYEDINHNTVEKIYGYRAMLEVEMKEIAEKGYRKYVELISILDTGNYDVYPFYNPDIPTVKHFVLDRINYEMMEDDKLTIEQLHKYFEKGQALNLKFKAKKLVRYRPTISNDEDSWTIVGKHFFTYNRFITKNN